MVQPPEPPIYKPFPAFTEWGMGEVATDDFDRYAELFARAKASANKAVLANAMKAAQRYAAVDTNAIEGIYETDRGFTRTVATQAAAWEAMMEARGAHVRPAFDDALNGYEYVLDAATQRVEISEVWIKEVHQIICKSQKTHKVYTPAGIQEHPLIKGTYKSMPNSPTLADGRVHAYAPVLDTAPEMQRLVEELRSLNFQDAHAVVQAAYAHYAYVCIHPFADGNGRVARALSSVYLYRYPGVPLIVFADQRNRYYDALEQADDGKPGPFVRFIADQTIDAINLIRTQLSNTAPPVADTLTSLSELFDPGARDEELVAGGLRLVAMAMEEAKRQIAELRLPEGLAVRVNPNRPAPLLKPPTGYVDLGREGGWNMHAHCAFPIVNVFASVNTFLRQSAAAPSDLLMASRHNNGLEVWLREVTPSAGELLKLKLTSWVEARIAEMLVSVQQVVERNKRR
ncbi:Fic family protein [Mycobacterium gordonae]|uniref:Fic family protein n=1 Tax=Mycobacterium gordonae TaxID=1778 RepID=UPI00210DF041|nr:Fic family protein [Mycobacterium gordonae]MCQ4360630.1 Fic family protein [Mycobacterium gordonae]